MPEFQPYLDAIAHHYDKWWNLYTLTDAEGKQKQESVPFFDFGLTVQTIVPKDEPELGDRSQPKIERFPVTEGLQKYAIGHVLLIGRPGSGKSTALARLMLDLVKGEKIPVLVELRSYQSSILELIRSSFKRHDLSLTTAEIETLLDDRKLILLIDSVNELPSESARTDLSNFRRNHSKVPMIFTTRDLGLGGDLGIEKKLEMQPLTETQMRSLVHAYLPGKADAMLGQLRDRLREFGTTPLLLWMLCSLFARTEVIPPNLGEVFRAFTRGYEQQVKQDVVMESDRRLWFDLLKQLAAAMMQGDKPTEFRVAIAPVEICTVFADYLKTENPLVPRQALDDLLRHHLIQRNGDLVEFRHQLIQEYYAAEWLLERVGTLDDETLECDYLNYLKWTEPLALMLALVEDEALAVRVVDRALAVDLMLGARLAGEVRSGLQEKTVGLVNDFNIMNYQKSGISQLFSSKRTHFWLKILMLEKTQSLYSLSTLNKALQNKNPNIRKITSDSLGRMGYLEAAPKLLQILYDRDCFVSSSAINSLEILSWEGTIPILLTKINHKDSHVRRITAKLLGKMGGSDIVPQLIQRLCDDDSDVRSSAAEALGNIGDLKVVKELMKLLDDKDSYVRASAIGSLGRLESLEAVQKIRQALYDSEQNVRSHAVMALRGFELKYTTPDITAAIQDQLYLTERSRNDSLMKMLECFMGDQKNKEGLIINDIQKLNGTEQKELTSSCVKNISNRDISVSQYSAFVLGIIGDETVVKSLLVALNKGPSNLKLIAGEALGKLSLKQSIVGLIKALKHRKNYVRTIAADVLGKYQDDRASHILSNLLNLLPTKFGEHSLSAIQGIQSHCKFYNYEIYKKTIDRKPTAAARCNPPQNTYEIKAEVVQIIENNYGTVTGNHNPPQEPPC